MKSSEGLLGCKLHQLFTNTLATLNTVTNRLALHLALKPTATMIQAARPRRETMARKRVNLPWKANPMNRKIKRTRPASWKLRIERDEMA